MRAESEIGDGDHKAEAEEYETIGETIEDIGGLFGEMDIERKVGRGTVGRVRLGDRDFPL